MSAIIVKFRERTQLWYNDVIKRKIEAGVAGISKKKKDLGREKIGKSLSAPAVSNPHWEAPILKVQARY